MATSFSKIKVYTIDDSDYWLQIVFEMYFDSKIFFKYTVCEPNLEPLEKWRDFVNGNAITLNFYQGNGDGCIKSDGNTATFISMPSGAGGDVISEMKVPLSLFSQQLNDVLEKCVIEY